MVATPWATDDHPTGSISNASAPEAQQLIEGLDDHPLNLLRVRPDAAELFRRSVPKRGLFAG